MADGATQEDAQLILKLYELRTESVMREARAWTMDVFWPRTAQEVLDVFAELGSQENHFLRQVTTYWEMACSLVLHGTVDPALFLDCNMEPFFVYAKFEPLMADIRKERPMFLKKTGELMERLPEAAQRLETMRVWVQARRAKGWNGGA